MRRLAEEMLLCTDDEWFTLLVGLSDESTTSWLTQLTNCQWTWMMDWINCEVCHECYEADGNLSERELTFTFTICYRPSVCLSSVCLSVTFVHLTQLVEIFGNIFMLFGTLAIR